MSRNWHTVSKMKVRVREQAITVTMFPCVPVNSPIQVPPCAILCVEHRQTNLSRQGKRFTCISTLQHPSIFLITFSYPRSLRSLYLRNANLQARTQQSLKRLAMNRTTTVLFPSPPTHSCCQHIHNGS
jgi:hypothetical protein